MHHSDRGTTYASGAYQDVLAHHGIVCSMSRKGDCWDNAVVESFFSTLEFECARGEAFPTRSAARREVAEYILLLQPDQTALDSGLPQPDGV